MDLFKKEFSKEEAAWHSQRKNGIGGSEIAAILGESPWTTAFQLWEQKTGKRKAPDISNLPHVQRGIKGEKFCRELLELEIGSKYIPRTWEVEGIPYRCTDDGYCESRDEILEIKCMGEEAHKAVKETKTIPEIYLHQCVWNLFVSGCARCRFISFDPENRDMAEVFILPNPKRIKLYKKKVDAFWKLVLEDKAPPLSDRDDLLLCSKDFESLSSQWIDLKGIVERSTEDLKKIEAKLKAFTEEHPRVRGTKVRATRVYRVGNVDYKRAFKEHEISEDAYRRRSTEMVRISRVKAVPEE